MRLLRLQDVEIGTNDRVFRHARLRALIVWLAGLAGSGALFYKSYTGKFPLGYLFAAFLLLFVLLYRKMFTARFHLSNWLVRMNETGIYLQYRSYLNYDFPADDPSVIFLVTRRDRLSSPRQRTGPDTRSDKERRHANSVPALCRPRVIRRYQGACGCVAE